MTPTPQQVLQARQAANLTQRMSAGVIGAAVRSWQDWERGRRNMPEAKYRLFVLLTARPEFILSKMGDMVFDGDEGYDELLNDFLTTTKGA